MLANIPNFGVQKPASQFGTPQTMAQGYSNLVPTAANAYQQMLAAQADPRARLAAALNPRDPAGNNLYNLQRQSGPAIEFANYLAKNTGTTPQAVLQQLSASGIDNFQPQLTAFGEWKDRDIQRQNASGMLSKGLGSMIPGLAMAAFPGVGLAKIATSAAIGGLGGGPKGALLGGVGSALAPSISMPGGIASIARAPVQAAANVAKQFANPSIAVRQIASSGIGSLNQRRA